MEKNKQRKLNNLPQLASLVVVMSEIIISIISSTYPIYNLSFKKIQEIQRLPETKKKFKLFFKKYNLNQIYFENYKLVFYHLQVILIPLSL